ncbi:MAG: hypothetical protein KKE79_04985 [Actinobacteria bacterium]|nr:hypothetical protein [Actinomycetota bacterium]MBU4302441.1 hypothetical protein [Actinomycetota bacterium]MBU4489971.1 hypothetical protein [Actinomycetota bacterium]MCG2796259.1 nitrophenyl compound nitroreductase subunit ArsF family protein [Actinomycetes bacterium]
MDRRMREAETRMRGFKAIPSLVLLFLLLVALLAGCCAARKDNGSGSTISKGDVEKVELVHFHPRFRCVSCNNIEKYAREVAGNDFKEQMEDGKLEYRSLEIEDENNRELVDELDVGGSSLYLIISGDGKRTHREIKDVWLYWDKPDEAKQIIKEDLSKYL